MVVIIFHAVLLIVGIIFLVSGLRLLFDKNYAKKNSYKSDKYFSARDAYIYGRYGMGIFSVIFGVMLAGYAIYALVSLL